MIGILLALTGSMLITTELLAALPVIGLLAARLMWNARPKAGAPRTLVSAGRASWSRSVWSADMGALPDADLHRMPNSTRDC